MLDENDNLNEEFIDELTYKILVSKIFEDEKIKGELNNIPLNEEGKSYGK